MKRQQAFIASMTNKVVSAGTLARPDRLVKFLNAATSSLTVDPDLEGLMKLADLGLQFQNTGLDKIQFITIRTSRTRRTRTASCGWSRRPRRSGTRSPTTRR